MNFFAKLSESKFLYTLMLISTLLLVAIYFIKGTMPTLDTKFFYLERTIHPFLEALGEDGRRRYMIINLIDFCFIASYSLLFVGAYYAFFQEQAKTLLIIPGLLALADLFETGTIYYLLKTFPEVNEKLEFALMFATPIKWFFALCSLLIIVNGYILKKYIAK